MVKENSMHYNFPLEMVFLDYDTKFELIKYSAIMEGRICWGIKKNKNILHELAKLKKTSTKEV